MRYFSKSYSMAIASLVINGLWVQPTVGMLPEHTANGVVDIGSRLELFVDDYLIDHLDRVELRLQRPQRMPLPKSPLRGGYVTVIKDGDLYRAWYRGNVAGFVPDPWFSGHPGEITCYAESLDGHEWIFPDLGIYDIEATQPFTSPTVKEDWHPNNVVLANLPPFSTNFSPFLDTREGVPENERYKAIAGHPGYNRDVEADGLHTFVSPDGIQWEKLSEDPAIPYDMSWMHAFDSQNVAFWSEEEGLYVCYLRLWMPREDVQLADDISARRGDHGGSRNLRAIGRSTSPDFINWSEPELTYPNLPGEHLYTSQTHPYFRAPHIYLATPSRYLAGRVREEATIPMRGSMDILFMTWRAGQNNYTRLFHDAFIRPGLDPMRWGNRANYVALNVVPTGPTEMSIWHTHSGHRYVLRTDGFVAAQAGAQPGELVTKPLTFSGDALFINYSTSAAGGVRVEIQDASGAPLEGFELENCLEIIGDEIERAVRWKGDPDLDALSGQAVRLRFVLLETDLFSFQFR